MKKCYFLLLFLLGGCAASPEYYSHSQTLTLEGISNHMDVFYQGEKIDPEIKETEDVTEQLKEKNFPQKDYVISRSWHDKELIIHKEGFEDYHLKLDSVFTSEPWATIEVAEEKHYFPLLGMIFPGKTVGNILTTAGDLLLSVFSIVTLSPIDAATYLVETGESLVELPKSIALDVYDILSIPGAPLINPWTQFQYNTVIVLQPTQAFKDKCDMRPHSFVSNDGCQLCSDSAYVLYATQDECAKCPNRQWQDGRCTLK